jgi:hypothetical protein
VENFPEEPFSWLKFEILTDLRDRERHDVTSKSISLIRFVSMEPLILLSDTVQLMRAVRSLLYL